jgi:glycerophosphoryl diester phosphodiesterase
MLGGLHEAMQRFSRIPGCVMAIDRKILLPAVERDDIIGNILRSIGVWAVNDKAELEYWFAKGIGLITTDRPDLALEVRTSLEKQ